MPLLFCNIGWMSRYEGLRGKPDKIVGGGAYVDEHESGGEVCNFLSADDGRVYGHVESMQARGDTEIDRQIAIEVLGARGDRATGVDVVWTATHPEERGRRVVGWYREATVFRERQFFARLPSRQHRRDQLQSYRIAAPAESVRRLELDERLDPALRMPRGRGWLGQTAWWSPKPGAGPDVVEFVDGVRERMAGQDGRATARSQTRGGGASTPAPATDPYMRYVPYERTVLPIHNDIQQKFEAFLAGSGAAEVQANHAHVDLRFRDPKRGTVLVEVKPCEVGNARYAVRTAIGQLLDYRQQAQEPVHAMLIVLGAVAAVFWRSSPSSLAQPRSDHRTSKAEPRGNATPKPFDKASSRSASGGCEPLHGSGQAVAKRAVGAEVADQLPGADALPP